MNTLEEKNRFSNIQNIIILSILIVIGIIIRFIIFPFDLPIYSDGEMYFWYANDMSLTGNFPDSGSNSIANNLWPMILAGFFSLFSSDNFIDYATLQRIVTASLSVGTIIPVFFLCRNFVGDRYAIMASSLFLFDPRLIQNSVSGLTEPLFILLGTCSIVLFLSNRMLFIYSSFIVLALFVLTRYEGLVLIIPLSIIFVLRFRKEKKKLIHVAICISIFFIIILSVDEIRHQTVEDPPKIEEFFKTAYIHYESPSKIVGEVCSIYPGQGYLEHQKLCSEYQSSENVLFSIISNAIINMIKYYGWLTIPLFFILIPYGFYKIVSKRDFKNYTIIFCAVFMLLPAFYAFSRDFEELRYFFFQIPFLCVLGGLSFEFLGKKIKNKKLLTVTIIPVIIFSSFIFFNDQISYDYELEQEYFEIAKKIDSENNIINMINPPDRYIRSAKIANLDQFPVLRDSFDLRSLEVFIPGQGYPMNHPKYDKYDEARNITSISDLIEYGKKNGLKNLVIDQDGDEISYLYDVFHNEENYPFLEKIYDSKDDGYRYHVKFFKIDYDRFDKNGN